MKRVTVVISHMMFQLRSHWSSMQYACYKQ